MSSFDVKGLCAAYGSRPVLSGLSFSLEEGRIMGVLGANGCGKTTLIRSICGILRHGGECRLDGVKLEGLGARRLSRLCSYIPQRSGIAIDISALDVVLMGFNPQLGLLERPTQAMKRQALDALERVGIGSLADMNYMHLSEGQKQLCILARTLVTNGRLLLLDEPESALDFHFRYRMLGILRDWVRQDRRFALVALHDPMLALNYCDELLLLKEGRSIGVIRPGSDSFERMENLLCEIYGRVSLTCCTDKAGRKHIIMLKEGAEAGESIDADHLCG